MGAAQWAQTQGWGVLRGLPPWLAFALSLLALDALLYGQHRLSHRWPWFWRLHRVHHADRELDVSSGVRFHPLEALLSMGLKMAAVVILGAPVGAVLAFELLLNLCALFNHANLRLPAGLETALRPLLITPAQHRLHHDVERVADAPNFGFSVPWWDWLGGSYLRARPENTPRQLGDPGLPTGTLRWGQVLWGIPLTPPADKATAGPCRSQSGSARRPWPDGRRPR